MLRQSIWAELKTFSTYVTGLWVAMRDFNAYLTSNDKKGGSNTNWNAVKQFGDFIQHAKLVDVDCVGERFTWERNLLKERIDWAFINNEWSHKYHFTQAHTERKQHCGNNFRDGQYQRRSSHSCALSLMERRIQHN
ncbi:hypothetical protein K1719_034314 [Acacia pycnantha]|nr:hypothetical protein K1719_034314 [Acacia pycnantha]